MSRASSLSAESVAEWLLWRGRHSPHRTAFVCGAESISYGNLARQSLASAAALERAGLAPGDRCALILDTCPGLLCLLFAVQHAGAVPLVLDPRSPATTLVRRIEAAGCSAAVCTADREAELRSAGLPEAVRLASLASLCAVDTGLPRHRKPPQPDDVSHLQLTSGTSGEPKFAVLLHRNVMACMSSTSAVIEPAGNDRLVSWLPFHHDFGLVRFAYWAVYAGLPAHLLKPAITSLRQWLQVITEVRATITGSPDFGYRICANSIDPAGIDIRSLRFAGNGGEPVCRATIEQFERRFGLVGAVRPGYGLAEATLGVATLRPGEPLAVDDDGHVACGQPLPGVEVRIEGAGDSACRTGEILVRSAQVFAGYWNDPEATRHAIVDDWLHTGDIGRLDDQGRLYVLGRGRAMIKRAGALIAPHEIEEAVNGLAGIRLTAAIGVTRESLGGTEDVVVIAEIRTDEIDTGAKRAAMARQVHEKAAGTLGFSPLKVLLVAPRTIPRTANGKLQHHELQQRYLRGELIKSGVVLFGTD